MEDLSKFPRAFKLDSDKNKENENTNVDSEEPQPVKREIDRTPMAISLERKEDSGNEKESNSGKENRVTGKMSNDNDIAESKLSSNEFPARNAKSPCQPQLLHLEATYAGKRGLFKCFVV